MMWLGRHRRRRGQQMPATPPPAPVAAPPALAPASLIPAGARMPLPLARPGQRVVLAEVCAGRQLTHRLAEMGLAPGQTLELISDASGACVVACRHGRLALGRGMAHKLLVVPSDAPENT